jgi:two-component system sensor histidine kinase/response regulator
MPSKKLDHLSKQIILKGFVPVILIIFCIVALQYYLYASNELQNNRKYLSVIAQNLSAKIQGSNQFAIGLAQTMAQAQTNGLFGDRLGSSQYAKDVLTSHPSLTGAYFAYEQNSDQSDQFFLTHAKEQAISKGLDETGRFLPYWYRDTTQQNAVTLAPLINMQSSLYYQGVKELFNKNMIPKYLVTEPYDYEGKLIVEQVFPIVIDGQFKGIAGVNRALTDLVSLLRLESQNDAVDVFLISDQGRFISTTIQQNSNLHTQFVEQTAYFELFAKPVLNRNVDWFDMAIDPFEQKEYFYISSNVKTGNWLIIVRKSKDLVTGIIWQTALLLLGFSLIGLIMSGWLINRVLTSTNKRINIALNAANELAKGEIPDSEQLQSTKTNDEISILLHSFNDVVNHYKNIRLACKRMADGDLSTRLIEKSTKDVLSQSLNALADKLNTTEKEMFEAMHKADSANQSKSQFLANMSHEIRTPMNAVLSLSRLCLNTALNKQQQDYLEKIHLSGSSLLNIINNILDFSKIESGKLELEKTPFSLESIFENLSSVSMPNAHQKGLELLFNVPYEPVKFRGDPLRIGQILINLTNNAVKFTEHGEVVVDVKVTKKDDTHNLITFTITDQGIGISPAQQQKLFSAFTQAHSSTTRHYGGTGLGLVICKNLVELMGGEIHISSELGEGTKVSFSIEFEQFKDKQIINKHVIPEAMQDMRILVVDDSKAARHIMQQQFERLSLTCDIVESGDEALQQLEKHAQISPYQLILIDWKMPSMDGLQTMQLIRENSKLPQTATILMTTAYYDEAEATLFKQQGINCFLKKPITDTDLYQMLVNCLAQSNSSDTSIDKNWQISSNTKLQDTYVLIVEDNLINQQITAEFLEQTGIKYDIVKNGKEAIEHVQKYQYDAVLMDLQMPIMGGIEATEIIRTLPKGKLLPIIAMSANAMQQHKQECLDAGMNSHIAKPIDVEQLYSTLEQFIGHGHAPVANIKLKQPDTHSELSIIIDELTHVDFNLAMTRSDGEICHVIKLMQIFKNSHANEHPIFEQAIIKNSHGETTNFAHSIAGVAEYVGAKNLGNLARAYENFDAATGPDKHMKILQCLYAEFNGVMQDLHRLLEAYTPNKSEMDSNREPDNNSISLETPATLLTFFAALSPLIDSQQMQQVLIVDDDPASILILQEWLKDTYQLSTAENGQQAIDKIAQNMPDLILLDVQMPIMDGFTTCENLKKTPQYADIPIIFISGESNVDEAKCLNLGAVDFVSKPFVKEVIKARVATHMALKQKNDLLLAKGLTDDLTQVPNRRAYKERITEELSRSKRDKTPLSLLMINLDKFKLYKENYGYLAGDQCLQKVASFLSLHLKRPADFIARISDEAFIVILPNTTLDGAHEMAVKLKNSVSSLAYEHSFSTHKVITVSIGVTSAEFANLKNVAAVMADELMSQADIGLYQAKEAGGNQVSGAVFV